MFEVVYFTSAEAREYEARLPADVQQAMASLGEIRFHDLRDPLLVSS